VWIVCSLEFKPLWAFAINQLRVPLRVSNRLAAMRIVPPEAARRTVTRRVTDEKQQRTAEAADTPGISLESDAA
jgi:hypothetical protein